MEELKQESPFIIKEDNFSIDIITKYQTPNGINQKGITIYKKNCEINFLNDESLSNSINMKKDNNSINSFANIGFISISDIICFLYLTKNDIILLNDSEEYTYYKVKNVHYIKMIEINNNSNNEDLNEIFKKHFDQFKKYFISENLFFSFCKYGSNILNHHIDSTNNICFNEKYFLLFKQTNTIEFITPLIKGFYTHLSIGNNILKESNDIKKDNDKNHEENKEDINKDENNNNTNLNIDIMIKYKINQTESNLINIDDVLNEDECIQEIEVIIYRDITDKKINYKFYSYSGQSCNDIDKLFQLFKASKNIIKGLILIALDLDYNNTGNDKDEDLQKSNKDNIFDIETTNDCKKNSIKKFISERTDKIRNIFVKDIKESSDDKDKNIIYDKLLVISGSSYNSIFNLTQEIIQSIVSFYYETNFNKENKDNSLVSKAKSSINNFFYIIDELLGKRTMKLIKLKFPKVSYVNREYIKSNLNVSLNMSLSLNNNNAGLNLINDNSSNNKVLNSFSLFILTYNVCGMNKETINAINFPELLFPEQANNYFSSKNNKKKYPLFFCIGLEEVINLNAKNVIIGGEKEKYALWEEKITSELKSKNNYILLTKSSLVGILFFIFVQASEISKISNINSAKTKTGFYGQLGNKGSCFVEFEYKNKKYGFNSGHLAAGENIKNNNERKINLLNILNHKSDKASQEFYQNDFYFILGDLNFRVKNSIKIIHNWLFNIKFNGNQNSKMEKVNENKNSIQNNIDNSNNNDNNAQKNENKDVESNSNSNYTSNITEVEEKLDDTFYHIDEKLFMKDFGNDYLKYDQLNIYKEELTKFNIKESNILFYPTYKYAKKSNNYNLSKREPSWTDRILFKDSKSIKSVLYNRINVDYSDHKPVFSIFEINY